MNWLNTSNFVGSFEDFDGINISSSKFGISRWESSGIGDLAPFMFRTANSESTRADFESGVLEFDTLKTL